MKILNASRQSARCITRPFGKLHFSFFPAIRPILRRSIDGARADLAHERESGLCGPIIPLIARRQLRRLVDEALLFPRAAIAVHRIRRRRNRRLHDPPASQRDLRHDLHKGNDKKMGAALNFFVSISGLIESLIRRAS